MAFMAAVTAEQQRLPFWKVTPPRWAPSDFIVELAKLSMLPEAEVIRMLLEPSVSMAFFI